MNPDPKESPPREILEELMEEGAQAFRSVLEKLVNLAMELERSEFPGAEPCERTGGADICRGKYFNFQGNQRKVYFWSQWAGESTPFR